MNRSGRANGKDRSRGSRTGAGLRCAIYTRKSSEEGLEQDFNSLHAQREACEAYVLSQKQEGWTVLPSHYDDGGFSGGKGTRYRYYVSHSLIKQGRAVLDAGRRVPAADVEGLVEDKIIALLRDAGAIFSAIDSFTPDVNERKAVVRRAADLAERWSKLVLSARRAVLQHLVVRIDLQRETLDLSIRSSAIPMVVDPGFNPVRSPSLNDEGLIIRLSIPARLKRAGMETRVLIEGAGGGPRREPDRSMLRLLARAQRFNAMILRGDGKTLAELASEVGVSASYFTRLLRLSFLAPDVVRAILSDRHPPELTANRLSLQVKLPHAWPDQKALLGIA